jgi:type IV pilus assembly protein PilM
MINLGILTRRKAVGLDIGSGAIKALTMERRGRRLRVTGIGVTPIEFGADSREVSQAINTALATAGADGEPVVTAVGGPEVVIRHVALPPLPATKIIPALEFQHRELGLLSPEEAALHAQVLRRSKDGASTEVLAVSVPRRLLDERMRLLEQSAVRVKVMDIEPLALLNGALHLTGLESGELIVAVTIGRQSTALCLFSELGPVVARYLEIGAEHFTERLRMVFGAAPYAADEFARDLSPSDLPQAEEACRAIIDRIAEDIRLSLAFYRSEYDRDGLPRYVLAGWSGLPQIGRWLADRIVLSAPFEVMNPFQAVEVNTQRSEFEAEPAGPQFLQAFGLALRGL